MKLKFGRRLWTQFTTTAAFLLISTTLIRAQTEMINHTVFPLIPDDIRCPPIMQAGPQPTCFEAYSECGGKFHLASWDVEKKCHPDYKNKEIIQKCSNFNATNFINDTALFAPMTSTKRNITYQNVYCGICNFEKQLLFEFDLWTPRLFCETTLKTVIDNPMNASLTRSAISPGVLDGLKVKVNSDGDSRLISVVNDTIEECRVLRVIPKHLEPHVNRCSLRVVIVMESDVVETVRKTFSRLFRANSSQPEEAKFCSIDATTPSMEWYCDYMDEYDDTCAISDFFSDEEGFTCNMDGYFRMNNSRGETILAKCTNHTSKKNHSYVCGPSKPSLYKKIKKIILNVMDHVSTFLLFLYLVLCGSKQNLRTLPKRIFYSYAVSLFMLYIFEFPSRYVESCVIKYYLFFYTWQSHSIWILITSFDLWRLVYSSLKIQKVDVEGQNRRFLIYSLLGWGLPAILLAALFPTLTGDQKSWTCPSVSGFRNELICTSSCDLNWYTLNFGWVTMAMFLIVAPCLLILTCVFVCRSTRNKARSTANRTYSIVLIKVAVMMGLNWMVLVYATLFDAGERFSVVYEFISSFHGCFIFFAFGLEKSNLNRFMRSARTTEQTQVMSISQSNQETGVKSERGEQSTELEN